MLTETLQNYSVCTSCKGSRLQITNKKTLVDTLEEVSDCRTCNGEGIIDNSYGNCRCGRAAIGTHGVCAFHLETNNLPICIRN